MVLFDPEKGRKFAYFRFKKIKKILLKIEKEKKAAILTINRFFRTVLHVFSLSAVFFEKISNKI